MDSKGVKCYVKAQAPVNIAVIKYWGKADEKLKIPINDSLSGTLSMDDMCTTTSVSLLSGKDDKFVLNGEEQDLNKSPAGQMLKDIRLLSNQITDSSVYVESSNNFPTAAGLASSASGYACLAFALGHAFGITDTTLLSKVARKGSGSACRSLLGGFVHWIKGDDHESSRAVQVADHNHWPSMRVIICVVNDSKKDVSSSKGMLRSVETSALINYRAEKIVPARTSAIKKAILEKDFESFADITMKDSNQFHAICLDTFPPIFYLSETSKEIIKACSIINDFYKQNKVAYTFDAGPNACIYLLEDYVPEFIQVLRYLFPSDCFEIKGRACAERDLNPKLKIELADKGVGVPNGIKYIINTSIGGSPKVVEIKRNDLQ